MSLGSPTMHCGGAGESAVIEMAKSFLNVRLSTRADVLDLIECGTSDST